MGGIRAGNFPPGAEVEIAVYEEVEESELERELVIPDDAFWITSKVETHKHQLIVQSVVVALVDDGYQPAYKISDGVWQNADEFDTAKRACYIALANADKDGFGWKEKEPTKPKCSRCNGFGVVLQPSQTTSGTVPATCPECNGTCKGE
jgi:hypothetical protein